MSFEIPFFNYSLLFKKHEKEYLDILQSVMSRGAFILQEEGRKFESELAQYLQVNHALGVANCTDGMAIALKVLGVGAGDEVILPSHTMVGTPDAVIAAGAKVILSECKEDHLIDPSHVERLITPKTKALMVVQLNGRVAPMDELMDICERNKIHLIEDAAQAIGAKYKGRYAGTFGTFGVFSFYPAKVLGCFGDGGAIATNDPKLAAQVFKFRNHGCDPERVIRGWGINSRLDNVQAAILSFNLKQLNTEIQIRRHIAKRYHEKLCGLPQLKLPPPPTEAGPHFDVFQNYEVEFERRDELIDYLNKKGIGTLLPWGGKAVHQWEDLGFRLDLPFTEEVFRKSLLLPLHTSLEISEVDRISEEIHNFYSAR